MKLSVFFLLNIFLFLIICSESAWPHGFVGQRFFPATIAIDDPFAGDELDLSTFVTESPADGGSTWTTNPVLTWDKRITPYMQASIAASYLHIKNPGQRAQNGFDDWNVGLLYEAYLNDLYESIFSLTFNATIGGTGSHIVDADSHTVYSPGILFGQGFGALSNSMKYLRPFAITGALVPNFETDHYDMTSISYGLVFEYSLPYLQAFVQSTSMPELMNHIIPLIEVPMSTCTQGDCSRQTTGTVNPGFLAVWKYGQIGLEGIIPINNRTGNKVGGVLQLHLYLDDIYPDSFLGKPIFS